MNGRSAGYSFFSDYKDDLTWFRGELASANVVVQAGSPFAADLQNLGILADGSIKQYVNQHGLDVRSVMRRLFGTAYLLRAMRRASNKLPWTALKAKYFDLLKGADIGLVEPRIVSGGDDDRNHVWELLIGCLASEFATGVAPDEPDLVCLHEGVRFGIACKYLYTQDVDRQVDRIVEGAKQIEDCNCDYGIVIANISSLIAHDDIFRHLMTLLDGNSLLGAFPSQTDLIATFQKLIGKVAFPLSRSGSLKGRLSFDRNKKVSRDKTRAVVLYAQSVSAMSFNGSPVPAPLTALVPLPVRGVVGPEGMLLERLNNAAQQVMWRH